MAAFTAKDPNDKSAYIEKYSKFVNDPTINMKTIKIGDEIIGSIAKFVMANEAGITYWIDRKYWGKGIGTQVLRTFLKTEPARPLFAYVAFDNFGSQKVLENCGFVKIGQDSGFANARNEVIDEYIYKLTD